MPEADAIARSTRGPVTAEMLTDDLASLGVAQGMTLLVHASLSSLGWVCGGPQTVVVALQTVLGDEGTLVVPTHSGANSDPAEWVSPPVPEQWWPTIRAATPAFDAHLTSTREMGALSDCVLRLPDMRRSEHPQVSFAAWGRQAAAVTAGHRLDDRLGRESPLGRLYDLDGWVLLLGVGHDRNTSLHLAEYAATWPSKHYKNYGAAVGAEGSRRWTTFTDVDIEDSDLSEIGAAFEAASGTARRGRVGHATATLMPQRPLVDFAVAWMTDNRS